MEIIEGFGMKEGWNVWNVWNFKTATNCINMLKYLQIFKLGDYSIVNLHLFLTQVNLEINFGICFFLIWMITVLQ